jgi:hypothetical protein
LGIPITNQPKGKNIVPRPKRGKPSPLSREIFPGAEDEDEDEDEDEGHVDYNQMDVDKPNEREYIKKPKANEALAMLTGSGYDELRPVACLTSGCMVRFNTVYEMSYHMELTHGWSVDDINEATGREETEFLSSEEIQQRELQKRKATAHLAGGSEETEFLSSDELLRRKLEASGRIDPQLA